MAEATVASKLVLTFAAKGVTERPDDGEREGEREGEALAGVVEGVCVTEGIGVGEKLGESVGVADGMPVRSHPDTLNRNAVVLRFHSVKEATLVTEPWSAIGIDALGDAAWLRYSHLSEEEEL
jgi:hypothetical protein